MRTSISLRVLAVALMACWFRVLATGQTTSATVTGEVSDPSGAAIPGATVVLENLETHVQSTDVTNSAGFYRATGRARQPTTSFRYPSWRDMGVGFLY